MPVYILAENDREYYRPANGYYAAGLAGEDERYGVKRIFERVEKDLISTSSKYKYYDYYVQLEENCFYEVKEKCGLCYCYVTSHDIHRITSFYSSTLKKDQILKIISDYKAELKVQKSVGSVVSAQ